MFGKFVIASLLITSVTSGAFADDAKKAAPMEMPKPAQQIADRAKMMGGTMKCTGTSAGMDGKDVAFSGTFTAKSDLDGWWLHESFSGIAGPAKGGMSYKFERFATFDASTKKWRYLFADNFGGQMVGTSDDMKDGKSEAQYEQQSAMGKSQMKDSVDASYLKKGVHMMGQLSMDSGKTWVKAYDMVCKK